MFTGISRGHLGFHAYFSALKPENVLLSGCGMTAAAQARRETTNNRGPIKGPLPIASRILRGATSGRMFEQTQHSGAY
jgi:hypothetical protein